MISFIYQGIRPLSVPSVGERNGSWTHEKTGCGQLFVRSERRSGLKGMRGQSNTKAHTLPQVFAYPAEGTKGEAGCMSR